MSLYPIRALAVVIGLLGSLASPFITHGAGLDLNANGMSDVWEIVFGASALTPNADTDGDGIPDAEERWLGFNPFSNRTDRQDLTDDVRVKTMISAASVVTLGTLDPRMSERWPDPGLVAVRRRGGLGDNPRCGPPTIWELEGILLVGPGDGLTEASSGFRDNDAAGSASPAHRVRSERNSGSLRST